MRIALDVSAVPDQPVGAGVYTIALARGLATRDDVELHLVARKNDRTRWEQFAPDATIHADAPARRPARLAWEQLGAPALARRISADVWHGPHYTVPLRLPTPRVVTVHDLTFFDHPEWHERSKVVFFRRMMRAAVARADLVICVSEYTASRLRVHCAPKGEIVVVPHGVDHKRFTPGDGEDLSVLSAHGISEPYIAFSGTIEPRKDVPSLVHAFARLAPEHPDLRLVLAGRDGWGADAARDAIASSGAATRIVRPGYLDNAAVAALFRHAVAVAYPSLEEGFGLPALEAMACATPLVTTSGSSVEEVVDDAALLVPPGDVGALADALRRVVDDPALAEKLRAAGPARAATFTWERSVAGHVDAYRRAAR